MLCLAEYDVWIPVKGNGVWELKFRSKTTKMYVYIFTYTAVLLVDYFVETSNLFVVVVEVWKLHVAE